MRAANRAARTAFLGSMVIGAFCRPAYADESKTQCLNAYEQGQRERKAGAFAQARRAFAICGSSSCPAALHPDCVRWLEEVEVATPRVVFRVSNSAGNELDGVSLKIDDGELQPLEGRAVLFDPGEHRLLFQRNGYRPVERSLSVSEQEAQTLAVVLEPISAPTATATREQPAVATQALDHGGPEQRGVTLVPTFVGLGVGVLGAASFAFFGLTARDGERGLADCSPTCSEGRVDRVKRDYLLANVSLGVAVVGLLGGGAWALFRPREPATSRGLVARTTLELQLGTVSWLKGRF